MTRKLIIKRFDNETGELMNTIIAVHMDITNGPTYSQTIIYEGEHLSQRHFVPIEGSNMCNGVLTVYYSDNTYIEVRRLIA